MHIRHKSYRSRIKRTVIKRDLAKGNLNSNWLWIYDLQCMYVLSEHSNTTKIEGLKQAMGQGTTEGRQGTWHYSVYTFKQITSHLLYYSYTNYNWSPTSHFSCSFPTIHFGVETRFTFDCEYSSWMSRCSPSKSVYAVCWRSFGPYSASLEVGLCVMFSSQISH